MARRAANKAAHQSRSRSFRLPERILELLDESARERGESANRLAEQLIDEGLHTRNHPLIHFRQGPAGERRPALIGTRLYVWQVVETVRASQGSAEEAATYLQLTPVQVRSCVGYYAEFQDEVDAYAEEEREVARREEARWRREQEVLG